MSDRVRERIHTTRSVAWQTNHRQKAHLNNECYYLNNNARKIDLAAYPVGYFEWCSVCLNRFERWHKNFHGYAPAEKPTTSFKCLE